MNVGQGWGHGQGNTHSVASGSMDRLWELETLRRSLAMLPPLSPGLKREEAMRLIAELEDAERRLRGLRDGLAKLLEDTPTS